MIIECKVTTKIMQHCCNVIPMVSKHHVASYVKYAADER
jgi:hypothetical protein